MVRSGKYKPHPETGSRVILTVRHLDQGPRNNEEDNLAALSQPSHNTYDAVKSHSDSGRREKEADDQY